MERRTGFPGLFAILLALLGAAGLAVAPAAAQQGPGMQRRAQLEQQVMQRFMQRAITEIGVPAASRARFTEIVREISADRRAINLAAQQLRRRMMQAVQDPGIKDAQFERMLQEQRTLRQREFDLWQREQARLGEVLTPRQRTQFTVLWLQLHENARNLMQQRRLGPGAGVGPGGPGRLQP